MKGFEPLHMFIFDRNLFNKRDLKKLTLKNFTPALLGRFFCFAKSKKTYPAKLGPVFLLRKKTGDRFLRSKNLSGPTIGSASQ